MKDSPVEQWPKVREMRGYDIRRDEHLFRWDAIINGRQEYVADVIRGSLNPMDVAKVQANARLRLAELANRENDMFIGLMV